MSIDINKYSSTKKKTESNEVKSSSSFSEFLNQDISFGNGKLKNKHREQFYTDLSILLKSGLDLNSTLNLLKEESGTKSLDAIYGNLVTSVKSGSSLSQSMIDTKKFSSYEFRSIKIGEETGKLPEILDELKKHYEDKNALRQQIIGMLTYPILVILVSAGVLIFLMNYVVPIFMSFLSQVDAELPYVTTLVMKISDLFITWVPYVIGFSILIGAILYSQRKQDWFRKFSGSASLRIPLFGKIIKRVQLARFCQSMSLLTKSKVQLIEALDMSKEMVDFHPLSVSLDQVRADVLKGNTLHDAMAKHSIFESRMIAMIRVGEEVNRLETVFDKLTSQYSDSVENQTKVMKSIIEPVLVIVVGSVVAMVALAMILPIFKMSSSMEF